MSTFFKLYKDYVDSTEPPANYHAWSGIGAISALLGKKVSVPQGHFTVFPNLYIVLVGAPAMRKTTAMSVAKNLVKLVGKVPIAPESSTREALIDDMAVNKVEAIINGKQVPYWQSAAFVSEMEQFLGGKHINQSMVGFLTAIWDEPFFKERTRKGGEVSIHNPYFTMLGCCTTDWIGGKLKQAVISDGFSRRAIFVLEEELHRLNPWPETTEASQKIFEKLVVEANRIHNIGGMFEFTKPARELYDRRYLVQREEATKHSPKVQNYFSSKHILVMKVAMCLSASVNSHRIIDSKTLEAAFLMLDVTERKLDQVFAGVGENVLKARSEKLLTAIREEGPTGMDRATLFRIAYDDSNSQEYGDMIQSLSLMGLIQIRQESLQDEPRYVAVQRGEQLPAVNLLQRVSQLVPSDEAKMPNSGSSALQRLLDPVTEQMLASLEEKKLRLESGLLVKGTKSEERLSEDFGLGLGQPKPDSVKPAVPEQ